MGIPTCRHEEWKYTRIGSLFNKEYQFTGNSNRCHSLQQTWMPFDCRVMKQANELVFVNGIYSHALSTIRSKELMVQSLEEAAKNEYKDIVAKHLGS